MLGTFLFSKEFDMDANEIPYDTKEDIPTTYSGYSWCPELDTVVETLATGQYNLDDYERKFINFLVEWGNEKGFLTWNEARLLGRMWKFHHNNDEYIHHDWWTEDDKLTPENIDALRKRFYQKMKDRK